jgi:hypothetical protein
MFCTKACLSVGTGVTVDYTASWDSEPGYDATSVEFDKCDDTWIRIAGGPNVYDSVSPKLSYSDAIADSLHSGSIRIRFHFNADGGWSDEDGLWDTDGAFIVDSLSISDNAGLVLAVEDFEGETVGSNSANDWESCNLPGFGDFAALYPALTVVQEDPCFTALSCVWGFFNGSTDSYGCGGFPGQLAVPKGNAQGQYLYNAIWSPVFNFSPSSDIELNFQMYPDLPLDNLVFWEYGVRSFVAGCPTNWRDDNLVYRNATKSWGQFSYDLADKIESGASTMQVRLSVRDMCIVWCGVFGTGACHSHGPLFDFAEVYAIESAGPIFAPLIGAFWNDNFAEDGTLTGTTRIDASIDVLPAASPNISNGDSMAIQVVDPSFGLATDDSTGFAAVYAYVGIFPQGQGGKAGDAIVDDNFRWPVVGSTTSPNGDTFYIIRMDSVFNQSGRTGLIADRYCVDLNDNLFTPGDTIQYMLAAKGGNGTFTYYYDTPNHIDIQSSSIPSQTNDIMVAWSNLMEVTCLPTVQNSGGDILYVDAYDGRGGQPYFETAFDMMGILDKVDRFDIRDSGSSALGQFGSRVQNTIAQLNPVYRKILWNSGHLNSNTIGDGTGNPIKADDFQNLYTFLDLNDNLPGLYLSGSGLASEWDGLTGAAALNLRGVYMNFNLVNADHAAIGEPSNPLVIGQSGGIFHHVTGADSFVALGGCPVLRTFDVITPTGASVLEAAYSNDVTHGASLSQVTPNSAGSTARVVLEGFSYHGIRDYKPAGIPARVHHLHDIILFLQNTPDVPTGTGNVAFTNRLGQNFPNPFNPTTTIDYRLKAAGPMTLRIYNVAGQLVRTLVDDSRQAGIDYQAFWDGRNDTGQSVSSGVYFYKLVARDFSQTRKMVLLK